MKSRVSSCRKMCFGLCRGAGRSPILRSSQKGLTLIELLLVITVIAALAALLFPAFSKVRDGARRRQAEIETRLIGQAIGAYRLQHRRLPAPENHLSGGVDREYGENEPDGNNGVVMALLRDADPPVLDASKFTWDGDNVLNPWRRQYRISLELSYSSGGVGYSVGVGGSAPPDS